MEHTVILPHKKMWEFLDHFLKKIKAGGFQKVSYNEIQGTLYKDKRKNLET